MHERALLDAADRAEPEDLRLRFGSHHLRRFVLGVQHEEVFGELVLRDARLRRGVVLKGSVPVEVVRRDVQHSCDSRSEGVDRLELKARHFEHIPRVVGTLTNKLDHGQADVAAHLRIDPGLLQDVADQRWWSWSCRSTR